MAELSHGLTGVAGEYYAAAELSRRGFIATVNRLVAWYVLCPLALFVVLAAQAQTTALTTPGLVRVKKASGTASITVAGKTTVLSVNSSILQSAMVKTGADSSAVLTFANGTTLQLGADTEVVIDEFVQDPFTRAIVVAELEEEPSPSRTRIRLSTGEVKVSVSKLLHSRGSGFTVMTPAGALEVRDGGVRGTSFRCVFCPQGIGGAFFTLRTKEGEMLFIPSGILMSQAGTSAIRGLAVPSGHVITFTAPASTSARGQLIVSAPPDSPLQVTKTVSPKVPPRPALLIGNKFGTQNVGAAAYDAKWSNYGAYLQRMIETIQMQWERIVIEQKANPAVGSLVAVKFVMNDEGRIMDISVVKTSANDSATRACVSAITDRMPYGLWTDDMKAVLGNKQEMTFTFYYQ